VSDSAPADGAPWIATCARGLEEILEREAVAAGLTVAGRETGGVAFRGDTTACLIANWRLRTANRVLAELASWPAADEQALYGGARSLVLDGAGTTAGLPLALAPGELLRPERTFALAATSSRSALRDTRWIALRVKDGLVDAQRERFGRRASVARERPDLPLRLRLRDDRATLLVDTSGDPLDRRGYRIESTAAPLREQLAAAAVLASGWDGRGPVVDPMCGSGTLLAEAGAIALGLPPNRLRTGWAFERLPGFEHAALERVRAAALPCPGPDVRLLGVDRDPAAVAAARRNLAAAGLAERARLEVGDAFAFEPPAGPGLLAVNPPHGERLAAAPDQWRRLGDLLKQRYRGWRAVVLAGGGDLGKHLGLKPARRIPVWNGPLEARILIFDLW
jgi:putative N6-adenine-specific DNA methylase